MRSVYVVGLIITVVSSAAYLYSLGPIPCAEPLLYKIGSFDERFNITKDEAKKSLAAAEVVWEKPAQRELFTYDESAPFLINFIFDDRQERTIVEEAERKALDKKEATSAQIAAEYSRLRSQYNENETKYKIEAAAYDKKIAAFNAKVAKYNSGGGAPADVFAALQAEEKALNREADALQKLSNDLASIAKKINDISEQGNQVIAQYNAGVKNYNKEFGEPNEFTQGDYQGDKINIYKFISTLELEKVLVHEFGHALGLGHVEGSGSMMYYLMADQPDTLEASAQDMLAFRTQCESKNNFINGYARFVRSIINSIIN